MIALGQLIYSNTALADTDGATAFNGHTTCVFVYNLGGSNVTVRLNNKYDVLIPANTIEYTAVPGDYTQIEVITGTSSVAVYAVG